MIRALILFAVVVLAGCSATPMAQLPPGDGPAVLCSQVVTLTATVRTVYVRGGQAGTTAVGADCAVAVQVRP